MDNISATWSGTISAEDGTITITSLVVKNSEGATLLESSNQFDAGTPATGILAWILQNMASAGVQSFDVQTLLDSGVAGISRPIEALVPLL